MLTRGTVVIPCGFISAGLLWALLGVTTTAGVIVFGVLYGFFSGGYLTVATVSLASTSVDASDVGWVFSFPCPRFSIAS